MSLSKNKIKYIQSLKEKKFRQEHGTFVAEGKKLIEELLLTCRCELVAGLPHILKEMPLQPQAEIIESAVEELKKASHFKSVPPVIAVFRQPNHKLSETNFSNNLHLVLDGIQDPGNLGTIVRLADWFGIEHVVCSPDTADIYNPKTVQATMGALGRVKIYYTHLPEFFDSYATNTPVMGTYLEGENIYNVALPKKGFVIMGNEGKGISKELSTYITHKLLIPHYPPEATVTESLNVAVATAIVCAELRRPDLKIT